MHDVTPGNVEFLASLLRDLEDRGVSAVNIAVVPRFHGQASWNGDDARRALAGVPPGIRAEILLHGWFHARSGENARLSPLRNLLSRLQSAGEDEFFALSASETEDRIRRGSRVVEAAFGRVPPVFIPPAWSGGRVLREVLRRDGFSVTEDHLWLYDLPRQRRQFSPVIAFATRSPRRERLSAIWARAVMRTPSPGTVLRFAFHPADYGSPATRAFALGLVEALTLTHEWGLYGEVLGPGSGPGRDRIRPISRLPSDVPRTAGS